MSDETSRSGVSTALIPAVAIPIVARSQVRVIQKAGRSLRYVMSRIQEAQVPDFFA